MMWNSQGNLNIPVIGSAMSGMQEHTRLKNVRKELVASANLQKRAISQAQRKDIGSYVADAGKSGVNLTLEQIAAQDMEYELDKAVLADQVSRQRNALDQAGDKARIQGFVNAGMEAGSMALGGMGKGAGGGFNMTEALKSGGLDTKAWGENISKFSSMFKRQPLDTDFQSYQFMKR